MAKHTISRRHFFFGTLLAGAIPQSGLRQRAVAQGTGLPVAQREAEYRGHRRRRPALRRPAPGETENIVALADVDWVRGEPGFQRWDKAAKFKDFRQMLDKAGKTIDAVVIATTRPHAHVRRPVVHGARQGRVRGEAADADRLGGAAAAGGGAEVQGGDADGEPGVFARGDAGGVRDHLGGGDWRGDGGARLDEPAELAAGDDEDAAADAGAGHARLGPVARNRGVPPVHGGRPGVQGLRDRAQRGASGRPAAAAGAAPAGDAAGRRRRAGRGRRRPGRAAAWEATTSDIYLPFNWRGFYDFGSSLIGDWGVHILGPANWGLFLSPEHLVSVECIKKDGLPPTTFPDVFTIKYEFKARNGMPPVTVYWYQYTGGDPYLPPGMTAEQARKIPNTGPQVGPARGAGPGGGAAGARAAAGAGGAAGARGTPAAAGAAAAQGARAGGMQQGSGYNCIFEGSKGHLGTSGRGEGVGLLPGDRWADYTLPPQLLTRSPGHIRDWIRACKGGSPACSQFEIAAPYTEWLVLGSAAVRVEGKLLYDAKTGLFTNSPAANKYLQLGYRKGWEVKI